MRQSTESEGLLQRPEISLGPSRFRAFIEIGRATLPRLTFFDVPRISRR